MVDSASVSDTAFVGKNARVFDNAVVRDSAVVHGDATVCGNAVIAGNAEVSVLYSVNRSDGYTFCIYNDLKLGLRISAGCRNFSVDEARKHWNKTRGGTLLGDESLYIVDYLEKSYALSTR